MKGTEQHREELAQRLRCVPRILAARNRRLAAPLGEEDLKDLAQETIVRIWRKLDSFDGRAALETWVYRFCFLELMNAVRRKARSLRSEDVVLVDLPEREPQATGGGDLLPLLGHLSEREREVIRLRHLEHLGSLREVSEAMDISLSSVKTHYYRALKKLRDLARPLGRAQGEPEGEV